MGSGMQPPETARKVEFDPVERVQKQWTLVRSAFGRLTTACGGSEQAAQFIIKLSGATDISSLQQYVLDSLLITPEDQKLSDVLALVSNMQTVAGLNPAMEQELPSLGPKTIEAAGNLAGEIFSEKFVKSLKRMDILATSLGTQTFENPIGNLKTSTR